MVRHYKRKTDRGPDPNNLKAALELVKQGHSIRSAAKSSNVNFITLSRAVKKNEGAPSGYSKHAKVDLGP